MTDAQETVPVALQYQHPDDWQPTTYAQNLAPDAIGILLLVIDALADRTDPDELRRMNEAIAAAVCIP